ncbi:hypothetical protein HKX48_007154 [Thoreauomyces humboldtii]|nr:hypothetical protein HKX48_007154 [Thoreauomyces humboldtii]
MRLRRIVRENHGSTINHCCFVPPPPPPPRRHPSSSSSPSSFSSNDRHRPVNVLATVASNQVNFYDNQHCGDHLDIMSHFVTDTSDEVLITATWLSMDEDDDDDDGNDDGDAVLATGGSSGVVHVISLTQSKEISQLRLPSAASSHRGGPGIVLLVGHPRDRNLLLAVMSDAIVVWHVASETVVGRVELDDGGVGGQDVACAAWHPDGRTIVTGGAKGAVRMWDAPTGILGLKVRDVEDGVFPIGIRESMRGPFEFHCQIIDSIHFVRTESTSHYNILTKSRDGKVVLWDPVTEEKIHTYRTSRTPNPCRTALSSDHRSFCIGDSNGRIQVYSLVDGERRAELGHPRSNKAVKACAFSSDDRNIVYVGDDSLIWRFDHIDESLLREWDDEEETDA